MEDIRKWSLPGHSVVPDSMERTCHSGLNYIIAEENITMEDRSQYDELSFFYCNELTDFEVFLNCLIAEITSLETRKKELTKTALATNFTKAAEVVVSYSLMIKRRLEDTVKELEDVINGTHGDRYEVSDLNVSLMQQGKKCLRKECVNKHQNSIESCTSDSGITIHGNRYQDEGTTVEPKQDDQFSILYLEASDYVTDSMSQDANEPFEELEGKEWINNLLYMLEGSWYYFVKYATRDNIEKAYSIVCTFPDNLYVERDFLKILQLASNYSKSCQYIHAVNCYAFLCIRFTELWPEWDDMCYSIVYTIYNLSRQPSLVAFTLQDLLLELFLIPMEVSEFGLIDIVCVDALCNMINASSLQWSFKMTWSEVETKIEKGMTKFALGKFSHMNTKDYTKHLKNMVDKIGVVRWFSLWYITNESFINPSECKHLREHGAVEKLCQLLAEHSLEPEIEQLAKTCLLHLDADNVDSLREITCNRKR